MLEEKEMY
jgi:hypothetical protein